MQIGTLRLDTNDEKCSRQKRYCFKFIVSLRREYYANDPFVQGSVMIFFKS